MEYGSRSVSPGRNKRSKFRKSRSKSLHRKHSKRHSPSRSWSRNSRRFSRSHSRRDRRNRSPIERKRRHDGDRENPKESRCLGVFGLNLQTDERALKDIFERYGPIDNLQVVYDYHTGKSRGFGFIYYKYIEDAVEAKEDAPGMEIDGKKIRVDFSITARAHTPTPGTYLGYNGKSTTSRNNMSPPSRGRHRSFSRDRSRGRY